MEALGIGHRAPVRGGKGRRGSRGGGGLRAPARPGEGSGRWGRSGSPARRPGGGGGVPCGVGGEFGGRPAVTMVPVVCVCVPHGVHDGERPGGCKGEGGGVLGRGARLRTGGVIEWDSCSWGRLVWLFSMPAVRGSPFGMNHGTRHPAELDRGTIRGHLFWVGAPGQVVPVGCVCVPHGGHDGDGRGGCKKDLRLGEWTGICAQTNSSRLHLQNRRTLYKSDVSPSGLAAGSPLVDCPIRYLYIAGHPWIIELIHTHRDPSENRPVAIRTKFTQVVVQ